MSDSTTPDVQVDGSNGSSLQLNEQLRLLLMLGDAVQHPSYKAGLYLQRYWLPVVVVVGLVCNTLAFLVMIQRQNRRISTCLYMAALALSDNMLLLLGGRYFLDTEVESLQGVLWECKILAWFFQGCSLNGSVLIMAMTLDRYVVVRFPLKAQSWCSAKRAKRTACIVFFVSLAYTSPYIVSTNVVEGVFCVASQTESTFTEIYSWFSIVFNAGVPFIFLLVVNALIIKNIKQAHKAQASLKGEIQGRKGNNKSKAKNTQLTVILLIVSFVFLVLTLPQYVRYAIFQVYDYKKDADTYANFALFYHVTNKLFFTNSTVNFFLYCLGGSKFRKNVWRLLCCRQQRKSRNRSLSTVSKDVQLPHTSVSTTAEPRYYER